jgi:sodium-dependent dicarboxylate transporter 2/3/5
MYFLAGFIVNSCLSSAPGIMIFLPILSEMLQQIGCEKGKGEPLTAMMMMGTVIVAQAANASTPIGHAMSLQGMSTYASFTGGRMEFFTFVVTLLPLGIASMVLWFAISKFLWRPDVSKLARVDFDALAATCGPVTKREKVSLFFYVACILLWVMPGLTKVFSPGALYPFFAPIDQCYPPMISLFLMNFIRDEKGEKVLDFQDALKNVNWNIFMFIGAVMSLGSFLSNADVGVKVCLYRRHYGLFDWNPSWRGNYRVTQSLIQDHRSRGKTGFPVSMEGKR